MLSQVIDYWNRLHWLTRLSILCSFAASLWWQTRYLSWFSCPQYGWPISYEYLWAHHGGRSLSMFTVDCVVWLILAGSTGYVVEQWQRRGNLLRRTRDKLFVTFVLVAVIGGLCVVGSIEAYFRGHPDNDSVCPPYAFLRDMNLWLDVGLFTDPVYRWPLTRLILLISIGSTIYTVGVLLYQTAHLVRRHPALGERVEGRSPHNHVHDEVICKGNRNPIVPRIAIWGLGVFDTLYLIWLFVPPIVVP